MKLIKKIAIFPIKIYQYGISPLLGPNCRYTPTCSQYAIEAINEWGIFKGWWLAIKRFSRCHPFSKTCGPDPVPENPNRKK